MDTFQAYDTTVGCDRWKLIDLGMVQTLLHALWKNISVKTSATVSILTTVLISLCDTISDLSIAISIWTTFQVGLWLPTIVAQNGGAKCNVQRRSF